MKVYTYCNYRGSLGGYQFAVFDWDGPDSVVKSIDMSQVQDTIPGGIVDWFWSCSGWKLVLQTGEPRSEGLLLVRGIEKAVNFRRKQIQDRQEDQKHGAEFVGGTKPDQLSLPEDARFYINLCFEGAMKKLRPLAASFLGELRRDGGVHLLELLLPALDSVELTHYSVGTSRFKEAIARLQPAAVPDIPVEPPRKRLPSVLFRKAPPGPVMQLDRTDGTSKSERQQKLDRLTGRLLRSENFSDTLLLYVADGEPVPRGMTAHLVVELDYILSTVTWRH